jgi:hypothetical protein
MVHDKSKRMDGISYILGLIERIHKVEGVDDCPLFLDFEW